MLRVPVPSAVRVVFIDPCPLSKKGLSTCNAQPWKADGVIIEQVYSPTTFDDSMQANLHTYSFEKISWNRQTMQQSEMLVPHMPSPYLPLPSPARCAQS